MNLRLYGKITGIDSGYRRVECDRARDGVNFIVAPEHLRVVYLTPFEANGAEPGETVELIYMRGPTRGAWVVAKPPSPPRQ